MIAIDVDWCIYWKSTLLSKSGINKEKPKPISSKSTRVEVDILGKVMACLNKHQGAITISIQNPRSKIVASVDGENN
jgi:hypothetical protein